MSAAQPILWHIAVSHYSEKVRWALDYKGIEHERRLPPPGLHMPVVLWLTRGRSYTLPAMDLGGRRLADSTAIIAALEERYPEPPLYPSEPVQRRRALALEDWFDEELAPYARRLVFHELGRDRERLERSVAKATPALYEKLGPAAVGYARMFTKVRYGTHAEAGAERARQRIVAGFDRLEAELGDDGYLVGGRFTVADLTAAALFYPVVMPPEAPRLLTDLPEPYERFRAQVRDRPGWRWVEEMFRRHRRKERAPAPQDVGAAA
jgi:glutathione S-transferase